MSLTQSRGERIGIGLILAAIVLVAPALKWEQLWPLCIPAILCLCFGYALLITS